MQIQFSDLKFKPLQDNESSIGVQATIFFDNGHGASIIKTPYGYGGKEGFYGLAVIKANENGWDLNFNTPITNNVLGYLTENDLLNYLEKIKKLPNQ